MWCSAIGCIVTLTLSLLAAPLASDAQRVGKVARIGYLSPVAPGPSPILVAFRQGLGQLGWVEGENLAIEYRWAEGRLDPLPDLAAELVRLKVDVIVTWGPAVGAAQQATRTIPIVIASTLDAVQSGFVASLAQPGGNIESLVPLHNGARNAATPIEQSRLRLDKLIERRVIGARCVTQTLLV